MKLVLKDQAIEKEIGVTHLPVMEEYYTIQGEGFNTGTPAYFIRLGGCDVGCHWCDVKESWEAGDHLLVQIDKLVKDASRFPSKTVVITGGEPLMYNLDTFCKALHENKIKIFLETSGAYSVSGKWDWICVSPKKFKAPLQETLSVAHELKVIIFNKSDFEWSKEHAKKVSPNCKLFLQPEWGKSKEILPLMIDYVKENPKWKISLQTHKFMNIP